MIASYVAALTQLGRHPEALGHWDRVLEMTQGQPTFRAWRVWSLMQAGDEECALDTVRDLEALRERESLPALVLWFACAAAGRVEEAFHWLDIAEREEGGISALFPAMPFINPIRRDPRFRALMRRYEVEDEVWIRMMED